MNAPVSLAAEMATLPEHEVESVLASLTEDQLNELLWDWRFWARPEQLAPEGSWSTWVIDAGRGFGKTRAGSEWVREKVEQGCKRIALVGETYKDLVEIMCYGDSGIESVFPPHQAPKIVANPNVSITFHTGAIALGYNATKPNQLRGPQFDAAWCDELAKWMYARETWDMLQFGLRLGENPQALVTTTPRPIPVLKEILADKDTVHTRGSTFDNAANLAPPFLEKIRRKYEGTRLGRQELHAEMLDDLPGALWTRDMFDENRVFRPPELQRVVVAVDPSGSNGDGENSANSIGIVVAAKGVDGKGYVLADRSCNLSPDGWGRRAVAAYHEFKADRIVAERNFGGAMVEHVIRTVNRSVSYQEVTASRGKVARAEPVAALYEQKRVHHVGSLPELEDQCALIGPNGFEGDGSPDRVDALVWALSELMLDGSSYGWKGAI